MLSTGAILANLSYSLEIAQFPQSSLSHLSLCKGIWGFGARAVVSQLPERSSYSLYHESFWKPLQGRLGIRSRCQPQSSGKGVATAPGSWCAQAQATSSTRLSHGCDVHTHNPFLSCFLSSQPHVQHTCSMNTIKDSRLFSHSSGSSLSWGYLSQPT